jgi:RNA polymerase sigma-70 factor (ECF subfamily)
MAEYARTVARWLPEAHAGSAEALGQVLEACRGYLLQIAQQELDPELRAKGGASDLVQDTFVKAQRHFAHFQGDSEVEVRAWLRRLLLNNLADFRALYREAGKRQVAREVALGGGGSSVDLAASLAAAEPSPSGVAMEHEQAEAMHRVLERLPAEYRRVLLLRYEGERTFEEIGLVLGRSANGARKLWARAVERFQHEWEAGP